MIKGLAINRFDRSISIPQGTTGNKIEGNFIGTNASGATDLLGNGDTGVDIGASVGADDGAIFNTIGGASPGARNVISGNNEEGISISNIPW